LEIIHHHHHPRLFHLFSDKKSHSKPFTRAVSPVFPKSQDLWIDHHNYYMHSLKTNSDLPTTTKKKKTQH
jgi:hypothetical protein